MFRKIAAGWILAFLGSVSAVLDVIFTVIFSLEADKFVFGTGQLVWFVVSVIVFVTGVILFVRRAFGAVDDAGKGVF